MLWLVLALTVPISTSKHAPQGVVLHTAHSMTIAGHELARKEVWVSGKRVLFCHVISWDGMNLTEAYPIKLDPISVHPKTRSLEDWLEQSYGITGPVRPVGNQPSVRAFWPHTDGLLDVVGGVVQTDEHTRWMVWSAAGAVVHVAPLQLRNAVVGRVFMPNPIVTSSGQDLRDNEDSDSGIAANFYTDVVLEGLDSVSPLTISGRYAIQQEISPPETEMATSETDFRYTRSDDRFEAVQVYAHIERAQAYLASLSIEGLQQRPIPFDPHALNGADASQFSIWNGDPMGTLEFGDGSVDDAEDADLIYHEYFHALHFAMVGERIFDPAINPDLPPSQRTDESGALVEGCADYFAHTMTFDLKSNHGTDVHALMQWNAAGIQPENGPPFYQRRTDFAGAYPQALTGSRHLDGQIIASLMADLRAQLGAQVIDSLLFASLAILPPQALFRDFARALLEADYFLFQGSHQAPIENAIVAHGLAQPSVAYSISRNLGDSVAVTLVNPNETDITVAIHGLDESGTVRGMVHASLEAKSATELDPASLFPQAVSSLRFSADQLFIGHTVYQSSDGLNMAAVPLLERQTSAYIPHVAQNTQSWSTHTSMLNLSQARAVVIGNETFQFDGYGHWEDLNLDSVASLGVTHTSIEDAPHCAFEWFQRVDGADQMAALPLTPYAAADIQIAHVASDTANFWTGIAFVNANDVSNSVEATLFDQSGRSLASKTVELAPNSKWLGLAEQLFDNNLPQGGSHIALSGTAPITAYELFGTQNGRSLAGLQVVPPSSHIALTGVLVNDQSWTGIAIVNPHQARIRLAFSAYSISGQLVGEASVELPEKGKLVSLVEQLFQGGNAPLISWIDVMSPLPVNGFVLRGDLPLRQTMMGLEAHDLTR
ncbi:MAG: hypothetical protein KDC35_13695 [Acidobacteria bacterium]|nr:hypothetical protein [Acidobacteriota bacterium]